MSALVHFDHVVVFAYRGKERPIDLFRTFDPDEHVVFVTMYQAGPFLLDPFYHTAGEARKGFSGCATWRPTDFSRVNISAAITLRPGGRGNRLLRRRFLRVSPWCCR